MTEPAAQKEDLADIRAVLQGDTDAYRGIISRHRDRVFAIVSRHVPPQDAAETAHEAFVRAFRSLSGYKPVKPFGHWLSVITTRTCHDYWRSHYSRKETPVSQLSDQPGDYFETRRQESGDALGENPETSEMRRQELRQLDAALARLSADDRMVVTLTALEERPVREVAELLGMNVTAVKVRAFRARKRLRKLLEE